jgi:integrase
MKAPTAAVFAVTLRCVFQLVGILRIEEATECAAPITADAPVCAILEFVWVAPSTSRLRFAADPPRLTKGADMEAWSGQDLRRFLAEVKEDRLYPLYLLAATTGMRRGELLGLRWVDLDLEKARLSVMQTLISVAYKAQFSEPKTKRSRRTIAIDPATLAALKAQRAAPKGRERLAWGPAWTDTGLVFTREDGHFIHPEAVSQGFEALTVRLQLPKLSFHGLRHSYATLALASGMKPWDLSDRLGHSSVAFTLQVYRHAIPAAQDEAASAAAAFILG